MPKPNFFIIGAPKCGTTSLSTYLREHPNIYMCTPKEPHYFSTDLPKYRFVTTLDAYLNLFDAAKAEHSIIGESSATYLYSKEAVPSIFSSAPDAKLIVMLRNPVDMIYSMHSQLLQSCDENEKNFENAWSLIPKRKNGLHIPKRCRDSKLLYYDELGLLGKQVERINEIFPDKQIMYIFAEDFFTDTLSVYRNVLEYLGLEDDNRHAFPKLNQNKHHKFALIRNFIRYPPGSLVSAGMTLKQTLGIERLGIMNMLRKLNVSNTKRKRLEPEFRNTLIEYFKEDIMKLSDITGKNLQNWISSDE